MVADCLMLSSRTRGAAPSIAVAAPLSLAAAHFGLGHGRGAHARDEYYVIDSTNPAVRGYDGAVMSFVDYLYELSK